MRRYSPVVAGISGGRAWPIKDRSR